MNAMTRVDTKLLGYPGIGWEAPEDLTMDAMGVMPNHFMIHRRMDRLILIFAQSRTGDGFHVGMRGLELMRSWRKLYTGGMFGVLENRDGDVVNFKKALDLHFDLIRGPGLRGGMASSFSATRSLTPDQNKGYGAYVIVNENFTPVGR